MFFNYNTLNLGSNETETIRIENNKLTGKNYVNLFYNEGKSLTINSKNIDIISNILSSTGGGYSYSNSYLFGNSGTLNLGSNKTEKITIKNNTLTGKRRVYLFSSTTINSKNIIDISNNKLSSKEEGSVLFNNKGILTLGSNETEKITIENNKLTGEHGNSLLFNNIYSTLNINGSNILIKNNIISIYNYGDYENYYAIYNNGIININLYGDNPTFKMSKNKTTEGNEKLTADILDYIDSKLNFINNSNKEAIIKLGNGIKGEGFITFKNNGDKNGSFEVELGSMGIEAKNINIRSNVTLLLSINIEGLIGGLKGYSNDSELNIDNNKQLIIKLQNIKNVNKPQDSYTIISNFENNLLNNLVSNEKIVLGNDQIIIGGIVYDLSLIVPEGENNMILSLEEKTEEEE